MLQRKSRAGRKAIWFAGCSAALFATGTPGFAAAQSAPDANADEAAQAQGQESGGDIVVTGTRIDRPGFESPTPLLRLTQEDLQIVSRTNIGAALADLPQFKAAASPQTSSTNTDAGRFPINIRGLGDRRSLILLDGRRLVSDDLNTVPSIMIENVDIVTGGASAAWGSDAVAGVVNMITDGGYEGIRLGAEAGISSRGDARQIRFEGKFGTSFADGRGHFVIGAEYVDNDGIVPKTARKNTARFANVNNTLTPDVGHATRLRGGFITSGVLKGFGFNPDGSLRTPNLGTIVGSNMIGGEGASNDDISVLITPQRRYAVMAKASYELTDTLKLSVDMRYSRYYNHYVWFGSHSDNITINSDNAYLNDAARLAMANAGQTSFTLSRFNDDLSFADVDVDRRNIQGSIALDGSFGDGRWRYSAYYSHGEYRNKLRTPGFLITQNFARAVDSVIDPATDDPICRITLTNPNSGCVPINLFGVGAPSQAAIDYVTGTPRSDVLDKLDTYGVSLRGEPFELPAGPVSIAIGAEGRNLSTAAKVGELDAAQAFSTFFFSGFSGKYNIKEAFGEIVVPVVKDVPLLRKLELNGAVRASDYNTSGTIWSWKVGLTNEFVPGVIGRVTRSRDIRAPNLTELYSTPTVGYIGIIDPQNPGNGSNSTLVYGGGNATLEPERADTWTAGFTTAPMRGLTASIDYFNISIKDVITSIGGQAIVDRCFAGNTSLCRYITRGSDGLIDSISSSQVNLSEFKTDGVDAEVAYSMPVNNAANGRVIFRLIGTWVNNFSTDDGVTKIDYVKTQGTAFVNGVPRIRANASISYASDGFSGTVRARYISSGFWNSTLPALTNNRIPAYTYVDLQLSQKIPVSEGKDFELYGSISNLFDKAPPLSSGFSPYYDVVGRYMSVGARLEF
ncbi:outer membrane receptor protein involved in Fe transport [Sphingopyxis panaciterrae]|uniref:TonB-dependent receptor domain-containing protein n=1 Tax=Sphingopyxis panaciterrae TaxID=363841 RepID=UPI00141FE108|nr:TonB-dependent receptor [Sphingopyxis panaciterrae]NIJ35830.1 outer membrane receptor protein involved in Fe transport [Sphingopyxis panaciterrae]